MAVVGLAKRSAAFMTMKAGRGDEPLGLQDAIDAGLGDEGLLASVKATATSRGESSGSSRASSMILVADLVGDAVPDALRPRLAVFERVEAAGRVAVEPGVEGRLGNADLVERAPDRQSARSRRCG